MTSPEQDLWTRLGGQMDNPIIFALVLAAVVYLFVSKRLAEISGPIGALARWWNGRQIARVQRQRGLWKAQHEADDERHDARMGQMQAELDWVTRELTDMRRREQLRDGQARRHTAWDNDVVAKLQAAHIPVADPPPLYLDLAPLHIPEET